MWKWVALMSCNRTPRVLLLSLLVVTFLGCGKAEKQYKIGKVKGRLTLDDKPMKAGCVVVFHPSSGESIPGSGLVKVDGSYEIANIKGPGVPLGEYKVTVAPPPLPPAEQKEVDQKNGSAIMSALVNKDPKSLRKNLIIPQIEFVPERYRTPGTTPLRITVDGAESTVDFKLETSPNTRNK